MFKTVLKRGFKFLDKNKPGWEKEINLRELNMKNCCNCILGQLYDGNYYRGNRLLGLTDWDEIMGFYTPSSRGNRLLTTEAKELIRERIK